jgi:hypothetical protein
MRSEREVKEKLRKATQVSREKAYAEHLSRLPQNCVHNDKGACTFPVKSPDAGEWHLYVCIGKDDARTCPHFTPALTKEELKAAVDTEMTIPEVCFRKHRDVAILQWVLEQGEPGELHPRLKAWETLKRWGHTVTNTWNRILYGATWNR